MGRTDTAKAIPEVSQPRWQFPNMNGSREKVIQMLCQLFWGGSTHIVQISYNFLEKARFPGKLIHTLQEPWAFSPFLPVQRRNYIRKGVGRT